MATPKRVSAASLVLDYNLYPRHQIDVTNVRALVDAMAAGVTLPPVAADRASNRVVDGFHRVTAYLRHFGAEATIAVEWLDGLSDADLFLEAARRNASHGRKLAPYDVARCYVRATELGIDPAVLASAVALTKDRLVHLGLRKTAFSADGPSPDSSLVPIKQTLQHLAQHPLSETQQVGNERAGGMHLLAYVNQVLNALDNELVDWENPRLVDGLRALAHRLDAVLAAHAA